MEVFDHALGDVFPTVIRQFRFGHVLDLPAVQKLGATRNIVGISGGPLWKPEEQHWDDSNPSQLYSIWIVVGSDWNEIPKEFPYQLHIWRRECRIVDFYASSTPKTLDNATVSECLNTRIL